MSQPALSLLGDDDGVCPSCGWLEVLVEDCRWSEIAGLETLLPPLIKETLSFAELSPASNCVSLALLNDESVRTLNRDFRATDRATNVLSFPSVVNSEAGAEGVFCIGDVALAFDTVQREAGRDGKPFIYHAAHLVVHGVLHLAGWDHTGDADADRMEAAERSILARFGIPDPYGSSPPL